MLAEVPPVPPGLGPVAYVVVAALSILAGAGGKVLFDALKARAEGRRADLKLGLEANGTRSALDRSHYDDLLKRQGDELTSARQLHASALDDLRRCVGEAGRLRAMVDMLMRSSEELKASGGRSFTASPFPIATIIMDSKGVIEKVSEEILSILHRHPMDLLRRSIRDLIPPDRHPLLEQRFASLRDPAGRPNPFEIVHVVALARDGRRVSVAMRLVPWVEGGDVTKITMYLQELPDDPGPPPYLIAGDEPSHAPS